MLLFVFRRLFLVDLGRCGSFPLCGFLYMVFSLVCWYYFVSGGPQVLLGLFSSPAAWDCVRPYVFLCLCFCLPRSVGRSVVLSVLLFVGTSVCLPVPNVTCVRSWFFLSAAPYEMTLPALTGTPKHGRMLLCGTRQDEFVTSNFRRTKLTPRTKEYRIKLGPRTEDYSTKLPPRTIKYRTKLPPGTK